MVVQVMSKEDVSDDSAEPPPEFLPRHVLLIYSHLERRDTGTEGDLLSDLETVDTAQGIAAALDSIGCPVTPVPVRCLDDAVAAAREFDPASTLVFNLCEVLPGMLDGDSVVLRSLEAMGFVVLGAGPAHLDSCRDKVDVKSRLLARRVATAPYQVFTTGREPVTVQFPAIVKPSLEHGSVGITWDSVVTDKASLRRRVEYVLDLYRQPALVEMFLEGREFNISVWDNDPPQVLPLAETNYGGWENPTQRLLNYDSKWVADAEVFDAFTVDCPAQVDARTARSIRKIALDAWRAMGCRDFIRVDMREKAGKLYVIDVNLNPCLAADAGFFKAARAAGYEYPAMLAHLVEIGWRRALDERMLLTA